MTDAAENKNIVSDLDSAGEIFKKIKFLNEEIQKKKDYAAKEKALIDAWEEKEIKDLNGKKEYYEGQIKAYFFEQRQINKKFKLSTPWGKISSRKINKFFYDDEVAAINYSEENELNCIENQKKLKKDMLKKLCPNGVNPETGEFVPGIRVEEIETINIKTE